MKKLLPFILLVLVSCKKEPADSDNDGIIDAEDQCPELVGLAQYQGCPAYTLTVNVNPSEGGSVSPSSEHTWNFCFFNCYCCRYIFLKVVRRCYWNYKQY